jgi:hypothetical protein
LGGLAHRSASIAYGASANRVRRNMIINACVSRMSFRRNAQMAFCV